MNRRSEEPHDELTKLADELLTAFRKLPGSEGVRVLAILETDERVGTVYDGWESDIDALAAFFAYLKVLMEMNGKKLVLVPIGQG